MRRTALAMLPILHVACGGLGTPDLGSGALAGRLQNASSAAYVYVYGRPDLVARPGADGAYAFPRVPVEAQALVVVDGGPGAWRASLVPVRVEAAGRGAAQDVDAAAMPLAGRVGVVARLAAGCESSTTRFTAVGTDRADVAAGAGTAALLEPLPAGTFELLATAKGFNATRTAVTVVAGATTAQDVLLPVDGQEGAPGCTAAGASCRTGFVCDRGSGACWECLSDSDCGSGSCVDRACAAPAPGAGEVCAPCTGGATCASGVCSTLGYCTRACADASECPVGLECGSDRAPGVCVAPKGCTEAKEELGEPCFHDEACADELAGGVCVGAQPDAAPPVPGYCTGRCVPGRAGDCALVPGYACSAAGRCEKL